VLEAYDAEGEEVSLIHLDDDRLRRLALFDIVVNNADRKGGHVLLASDGRVLGVDHGLCFHADDKLRTVLWGWAGEPIPDEHLDVVRRLGCDLDAELGRTLSELLSPEEMSALRARMARILSVKRFPEPGEGWPAIPWPVF
jgi:uncharacterized repeat protein (TIGR03843 family)